MEAVVRKRNPAARLSTTTLQSLLSLPRSSFLVSYIYHLSGRSNLLISLSSRIYLAFLSLSLSLITHPLSPSLYLSLLASLYLSLSLFLSLTIWVLYTRSLCLPSPPSFFSRATSPSHSLTHPERVTYHAPSMPFPEG